MPLRASRRLSAALLCLALLDASIATATPRDPTWGVDKALHLSVGLALGAGCYGFLWAVNGREDPRALRLALCSTLAQAPGLAKELYDSGRPGNFFSVKDLLWTSAGVLAGALVVWLVERLTTDRSNGPPTAATSHTLGASCCASSGSFVKAPSR